MAFPLSRYFAVALSGYYCISRKKSVCYCENGKIEERVFLFGDRRSLMKGIKQNGEVPFFSKNNIKVKKITFGNGIGSCITENDDIYIWGSYEDDEHKELVYTTPVKLNTDEGFTDVQFSNSDIYLMSKKGELKIVRCYKNCLKKNEFIVEDFYKCKNSFFFQSERIIKLSVNKYHLAFVTNKGNVYCSGNNLYGQCAKEPSLRNNFNINYNFEFANKINGTLHMFSKNSLGGVVQNGEEEEDPNEHTQKEDTPNGYSFRVKNKGTAVPSKCADSHDGIISSPPDGKIEPEDTPLCDTHDVDKISREINDSSSSLTYTNLRGEGGDDCEDEERLSHLITNDESYKCDKNNYVHINKVPFEGKTKIVDVSCGLNHTLCLDDENNIYSFGDDSKIQLGLGESRTNKNSLSGTSWKDQLKLGYSTVTKNLANYSFYDRHIQSIPQKVLKKKNDNEMVDKIYKINAGSNFSMIHSNDKFGKQLFCFGDNMYFQCGRHMGKHQQTLSTVKLPNNRIKDFSCGDKHCLLILNDRLYGWGYNNKHQITPYKNKGIINYPVHIFSQKYYPDNFDIKYVNASYNNSAVVVTQSIKAS
ncbi:regulator of chromosome condensation, putative [Plasmodium knowlesi strain H]|uniref:Regulator of chromosome condensation, putative n=3 Tax=Plasmodium knowlesi TaxID=5850 RepID=A0A5K1U516_PLAKH|nr:uncharacterized protein PKNH_0300900 [Plasmodium knowlesi strain H]OTN68532.1 putative Regulator of chromosome condensation [Plasmodium knowlesi]CAA9986437.1 regulator of chromosome condensation, putative [Plasmodium knowlesi strain H]SBO24317.1 regulator of chromosome condensation, putative [Plasmodium knowlesi strain H]SBO29685.1 regulator of chromosome condensation, putative [Plasmodium knowlesi strain H]VVS75911.1 regulator of chromosome condensation, putative [Plasmodium knowlesi strai|eukprot:XP_002260986.1 [Plasmodium knowlesi strain H]